MYYVVYTYIYVYVYMFRVYMRMHVHMYMYDLTHAKIDRSRFRYICMYINTR